MKIAIVDIGWKEIIGPNPMSGALGGSETWLMQISKEFVNNGNVVDLYCNTKNNFVFCGVNFICEKEFIDTKEIYDFVILNRFFVKHDINYIDLVKYKKIAKHVFIQIHDLSFILGGGLLPINTDISKYNLCSDFVTIVTLNEWHKSNLFAQYPTLRNSDVICIPNGVDLSLFKEHNFERDNRVLWSSCVERGLDILMNDVYPLVKKEIQDFGVDVAGYNDLSSIETEGKDIKVLGRLTKEQLYEEMSKHKVWFYPGTFAETFCITMLEQFLSGAQIVSPFTYGMRPTIGYADSIKMENVFKEPVYKQAVQEAADKIIEILKGKQAPEIYADIEKKIHEEYNWTYSVNSYITHYNSMNYIENKTEKSNKKILILSMSCNTPYFQALLGTIKNTWAKPVINGEYENVQWFAYTSCDKKHPIPCIDWDEHMIYVDCSDDINHTYIKTQKAYEIIKEAGIEFEYVIRTNTSVFINIKNMIEKVNQIDCTDILGGKVGYYHVFPDGRRIFQFNLIVGLFIGMSKERFDVAMTANNDYDSIPTADDVIISKRLFEVYGDINPISPNDCPSTFPRYKAFDPEELKDPNFYNAVKQSGGTFIFNPEDINRHVVIQVRPLYGELKERSEKGHEFEHFYELNDVLD